MSTAVTDRTPARSAARHVGPPLAAPALAFVGLFLLSLVLSPMLGSGSTPSPFSAPSVIEHYFTTSRTASRVNGFLQVDAAFALAVLSAVLHSRMRFLAPNVPGPVIAAAGGMIASVFLGLNGVLQWALSQPGATDQLPVVRTVQDVFFASGGPVHVAGLGLLIAGTAVTAWFLRLLPRWLCAAGVVIAAIAVLSLLALLVTGAAPLIPIGRFTGMIWLLVMAFMLPRSREQRRT